MRRVSTQTDKNLFCVETGGWLESDNELLTYLLGNRVGFDATGSLGAQSNRPNEVETLYSRSLSISPSTSHFILCFFAPSDARTNLQIIFLNISQRRR